MNAQFMCRPAASLFLYSRGPPMPYEAVFTRGVSVLRWASEDIRNDKELVRFLVWSNPSNLCDASPALQADPDIVFTALQSPHYWEDHPKTSSALVLLNASEELRKQRCLVLGAVALNGYEMQFAGEDLRADPYVVAWAGAPKGAGASMLCGSELVRFMNSLPQSGMSVSDVEADPKKLLDGYEKHIQTPSFGGFGDSRKVCIVEAWKNYSADRKEQWCKSMWTSVQIKMPLVYRVAPAVRAVLWPTPTVEEWDGAF